MGLSHPQTSIQFTSVVLKVIRFHISLCVGKIHKGILQKPSVQNVPCCLCVNVVTFPRMNIQHLSNRLYFSLTFAFMLFVHRLTLLLSGLRDQTGGQILLTSHGRSTAIPTSTVKQFHGKRWWFVEVAFQHCTQTSISQCSSRKWEAHLRRKRLWI